MPEAHAYLIGTTGLAVIFGFLSLLRKDLRRVMVYSGLSYLLYGFIMFLFIKLLTSNTADTAKTITPGYWAPPTLFDLNGRIGGYGAEDAFFSFFAGGIAAGLYNLLFRFRITRKADGKLRKGHAIIFAFAVGSIVLTLTPLNAIYFFIFLQLAGAVAIVWQRRDLFWHSIAGGAVFMLLYGMLFGVFIFLFPHFLSHYYHLQRTSHILIAGIPLEEYLYTLTLGMMWAPIYEYEFRLKDRKLRRSKLRRVSLVAATTTR